MKITAKYWPLAITAILIALAAVAGPSRAETTADEIKLGKEGATEVEKQYKLIDDKEKLKQLQAVLNKLGAASDEPKLTYTVKILDTKDVNALSLPGGPIYVTKGLLDYVQSEHELAGVIAHEVVHVAHHHMLKLIKKESKIDTGMIWAILAAVVAGQTQSEGFQGAMLGAQLLKVAKVNGYGKDLETDADLSGVTTLAKAGYNPVGMLTFMERLAVDDSRRGRVDMGIYQTHPESSDRAKAVEAKLLQMGVKINRRAVVGSQQVKARTSKVDGKDVAEIALGNEVLFRVAPDSAGKPNASRAEAIAGQLNSAISDNVQMFEVSARSTAQGAAIVIRGKQVVEILKSDLTDPAVTPKAAVDEFVSKLRRALWNESLQRAY